jgi:HEAT repeat protein
MGLVSKFLEFLDPNIDKLKETGNVRRLIKASRQGDYEIRGKAIHALGELGSAEAVERLVDSLEDQLLRDQATNALKMIGEPAVEQLIQTMSHDDYRVRIAAVQMLGEIGDWRAVKSLMSALEGDNSYGVRTQAAEALGRIGNQDALRSLISGLNDDHRNVQWAAAEALGKLNNLDALGPLIDAFETYRNVPALFSIEKLIFSDERGSVLEGTDAEAIIALARDIDQARSTVD